MSGARPTVLVTVGTDHHRFDRLIGWMDSWADDHPEIELVTQHGAADAPRNGRAIAMLGYDELVAAMADAAVVVTQGGPATIMDARSVGRRPIVVPRRAAHDEVVDDHQVAFTTWMAGKDLIWAADDPEGLRRELDAALADPDRVRIPPDDGAAPETIEAFAAVVDPLVARRRARTRQRRPRR